MKVHVWCCKKRKEKKNQLATNECHSKIANTVPILVYLPKLIFVAAFELPEVTFPKANKNIAFPFLNRELVEFLELFSRFVRINFSRKFGGFLFDI